MPEWEIVLLCAVAITMNGCGITWGLPSDIDWAIDSVAPVGPLAYVRRILGEHHWWSKYPPFHLGLLALVDAPYLGLLAARGAFHAGAAQYPYGFADPVAALGFLTLLARLVSAAMGVGVTVIAYLLGRELHSRRAGLVAGLLFAASPLTLYYSDTANLDIPYLFWSSIALLAVVRIARGASLRTYVVAGVCAALAVATKDQAYGLFLLLPVPLAMLPGWGGRLDRGSRSRLLCGLGAAVLTYVVAANVLLDWPGWCAHVRYITHEGSAPYRMFPATPGGYADLAARCVGFIAASMTWPAMLVGVVGAVWTIRSRVRGAAILVWALVSYFTSFIVPIMYVFPRFVLPAVFVLAIFAGIASASVWQRGTPLLRCGVAALGLYVVVYGTTMNLGLMFDSRYAAESWMEEHVPPGALVGTNGDLAYLPRVPRGARTIPVDIGADGPQLGETPPDFLVLSDAYYRRYLRHAATRPFVHALLSGGFGYERLAVFHRRGLAATELIPTVNPRIVILRRRAPGPLASFNDVDVAGVHASEYDVALAVPVDVRAR